MFTVFYVDIECGTYLQRWGRYLISFVMHRRHMELQSKPAGSGVVMSSHTVHLFNLVRNVIITSSHMNTHKRACLVAHLYWHMIDKSKKTI